MSANILSNYIIELERFLKSNEEETQLCQRVSVLKTKLSGIHSFEEALNFFDKIPRQSSPKQVTHFTQETLLGTIATWRKTLESNDVRRKETHAKLAKMPLDAKSESLRQLCLELLDNANCSLQFRYPGVIHRLNEPNLTELFTYMASLDNAAKPQKSLSGDFAAKTARNEHHAYCLQLMNNISAQYNLRHLPEHTLYNSAANDFMQDLLDVYENLFPVAEKKPEQDNTGECGFCLIS